MMVPILEDPAQSGITYNIISFVSRALLLKILGQFENNDVASLLNLTRKVLSEREQRNFV